MQFLTQTYSSNSANSEATVAKWHKKAGDPVKMDELLVELETDNRVRATKVEVYEHERNSASYEE